MRSAIHPLAVIWIVGALALSACSDPTPAAPPSASATPDTSTATVAAPTTRVESPPITEDLTPQDAATGLGAPWSVAFRDGVPLISERDTGSIVELTADGSTREVGVVEGVAARGEGGLLGLEVDGQGRLYAYHTTAGDNRIMRFELAGEPGSLSLTEPEVILDGLNKSTTHNGGRIAFGPDDMLYVTTGDAGVPKNSQDLGSLSGKILRMTPDGGVPPDNPFDASLVWTWGHRNVQGLAWADDGTMFASEFGQNTWDELNIIEAGNNYGWPTVEGIAGYPDFIDPVQQWSPKEASPSGMAYLDGTLYIANLRGQVLRTVPVADPSTSSTFWAKEYGRLRHVAVTPEGKLWVLTNNTDGRGNPVEGDDRIVEVLPEALVD